VAAGCCAVLNALADALGDDIFKKMQIAKCKLLNAC
jgi:hypothetical protein